MANPAKDARDKVKAKYPDAVVSRRGHKCIEHTVPSIPGKVVSDYSIGPFHYGLDYDQEIDTAWEAATAPWDHKMVEAGYNAYALANFSFGQIIKYVDPVSGEDIAFEPQGLYYSNDLDDEQEIVDAPQSVMATVTDDELYWTGAYGSGIDIRWLAGTASLYKGIIIARASDLPPVEQYIIDGGNPVLRVQFIFQHSQGVNVWVNGIKWDEKPNNPVETSGYVEFKDLSEKPLWAFDLPRSITADNDDPEQREIISVFRLRKTGPNLIVEHRISIDWLLSAVYPVEIDTTINEQVGASLAMLRK